MSGLIHVTRCLPLPLSDSAGGKFLCLVLVVDATLVIIRQQNTRPGWPSTPQAVIVNISGYGAAVPVVPALPPLHRCIVMYGSYCRTRLDTEGTVVRTMRRSDGSNIVFYINTRFMMMSRTTAW
jgi:hypothetical protein